LPDLLNLLLLKVPQSLAELRGLAGFVNPHPCQNSNGGSYKRFWNMVRTTDFVTPTTAAVVTAVPESAVVVMAPESPAGAA
jgi:hypothetical protein